MESRFVLANALTNNVDGAEGEVGGGLSEYGGKLRASCDWAMCAWMADVTLQEARGVEIHILFSFLTILFILPDPDR